MTFEQLRDFITTQMRMSADYQPRVIRALVSNGIRTLAQLETITKIPAATLKKMPLHVLMNRGVVVSRTTKDGIQGYTLNQTLFTDKELIEIQTLCNDKIKEFKAR